MTFGFEYAVGASRYIMVNAGTTNFTHTAALLFRYYFGADFIGFSITLAAGVDHRIGQRTVNIMRARDDFAVRHVAEGFYRLFVRRHRATLRDANGLLFFDLRRLLGLHLLTFRIFAHETRGISRQAGRFMRRNFFHTRRVTIARYTAGSAARCVAAIFVKQRCTVHSRRHAEAGIIDSCTRQFVTRVNHTDSFHCHLSRHTRRISIVIEIGILRRHDGALRARANVCEQLQRQFRHTVYLTIRLRRSSIPSLGMTITIFFQASQETAPGIITIVMRSFNTQTTQADIARLPRIIEYM